MVFIIILLLIVVVAGLTGFFVLRSKLENKIIGGVMKATGLGNKLNSVFDEQNKKALDKLEAMYKEGKITAEQYEKRKKNLMQDFDFNK